MFSKNLFSIDTHLISICKIYKKKIQLQISAVKEKKHKFAGHTKDDLLYERDYNEAKAIPKSLLARTGNTFTGSETSDLPTIQAYGVTLSVIMTSTHSHHNLDMMPERLVGEVTEALIRKDGSAKEITERTKAAGFIQKINSSFARFIAKLDVCIEDIVRSRLTVDNSLQDSPQNFITLTPGEMEDGVDFAMRSLAEVQTCIANADTSTFSTVSAHVAAGTVSFITVIFQEDKPIDGVWFEKVLNVLEHFVGEVENSVTTNLYGKPSNADAIPEDTKIYGEFQACMDWAMQNANSVIFNRVRSDAKTNEYANIWPAKPDGGDGV